MSTNNLLSKEWAAIAEKGRKVCEVLKDLYTFDDSYNGFRFRGVIPNPCCEFDEEDNSKLICKLIVEVDEVEYKLTGRMLTNKNGEEYPEKDLKNPKVISTKSHETEFMLSLDNLGVVTDENNKRKTTINSARLQPSLRFLKDTFKIYCKSPYRPRGYSNFYISLYTRKDKKRVPDGIVNLDMNKYVFKLVSLLKAYNIYENSNWLKKLGSTDSYSKWFDDEEDPDFSDEILQEIKKYKIEPNALTKLKLISKGEFQPTSDYLDANLLDFMMANFFVDVDKHDELDTEYEHLRKCDEYNVSTPLDFSFMDNIDGLCYDLQTFWKQIHNATKYNYSRLKQIPGTDKKEKARNLSTTATQNMITKYFHMQTDNFHDIQSTKDSNTLTMLSQKETIYFYDKDKTVVDGKKTEKWDKVRTYNKYFIGVLDPTRTRDGPLINKNNEFTLETSIDKNGTININVWDIHSRKEATLTYSEFVMEPILEADCFDENTWEIIPSKNKYDVLQYCSYKSYKSLKDLPKDIKYARKKTNILSYATSVIPFTNRMVSTRTLLASHFLDQSIPVTGAMPSVVHTSAPKNLYENNPDNVKYTLDEEAEVIDIKDSMVKVRTRSGDIEVFEPIGSSRYRKTSMATTNEYLPQVVVGQKIKPGQVLITSNSFNHGEFTTQVPLFVAFGTYEGREHEDGIILTQSAAAKFGHVTEFEVSCNLKSRFYYSFKHNEYHDSLNRKVEKIKLEKKLRKTKYPIDTRTDDEKEKQDKIDRQYNLDEWSLVKPGTIVTNGSILFEYYAYDKEEILNGLGQTFGNNFYKHSKQLMQLRVPYNIRKEGIVKEVKLIINNNPDLFEEGTLFDDLIDEESLIKKQEAKEYEAPGTFGIDKIDNTSAYKYFKSISDSKDSEILNFKEIKRKRGESSWVLSDEENAVELEIVIQYVDELTNERLGAKLSNFYASKGVNVFIIPDEYAPIVEGIVDENGNPQRIEGFINTGTTFSRQNPGQIDDCKLGLIGLETWRRIVSKPGNKTSKKAKTFLDKLYPKGWNWNQLTKDGKEFGYCRIEVDHFDTYYTPELIIELLNDLGLGDGDCYLILPEYNNKKTHYRCTVGVTSMMRLHFIQEHKASVTAESSEETDSDNITYRDMDKAGGQKIGQMEAMAALAHGINGVLKDVAIQKDTVSKGSKFTSAFMLLGMKLKR